MLALLAYGCPECAIVFAFGLDERTVRDWEQRAGPHCEHIHQHLIEQPRDLGQMQADEIRVKMQKLVVWVAMALQVSTRLWLGATMSEHRDETLVTELMQQVRACALCRLVITQNSIFEREWKALPQCGKIGLAIQSPHSWRQSHVHAKRRPSSGFIQTCHPTVAE